MFENRSLVNSYFYTKFIAKLIVNIHSSLTPSTFLTIQRILCFQIFSFRNGCLSNLLSLSLKSQTTIQCWEFTREEYCIYKQLSVPFSYNSVLNLVYVSARLIGEQVTVVFFKLVLLIMRSIASGNCGFFLISQAKYMAFMHVIKADQMLPDISNEITNHE